METRILFLVRALQIISSTDEPSQSQSSAHHSAHAGWTNATLLYPVVRQHAQDALLRFARQMQTQMRNRDQLLRLSTDLPN